MDQQKKNNTIIVRQKKDWYFKKRMSDCDNEIFLTIDKENFKQ